MSDPIMLSQATSAEEQANYTIFKVLLPPISVLLTWKVRLIINFIDAKMQVCWHMMQVISAQEVPVRIFQEVTNMNIERSTQR